MEQKKTLKTSALIRKLPDPVKNQIHDLLANGVVTPGVVVGGVLLTIDQLLGVEQSSICSHTGLVNDGRYQVNKDGPRHVFARPSLREEGGEAVISKCLVRRHMSIRLDTVLKTIELPTTVTNLATSLANVHGDTLTLNNTFKLVFKNILINFTIFTITDRQERN